MLSEDKESKNKMLEHKYSITCLTSYKSTYLLGDDRGNLFSIVDSYKLKKMAKLEFNDGKQ